MSATVTDTVDPRPRILAERLVLILNTTADSHAVICAEREIRKALCNAWGEGYDLGIGATWDDTTERVIDSDGEPITNPFSGVMP